MSIFDEYGAFHGYFVAITETMLSVSNMRQNAFTDTHFVCHDLIQTICRKYRYTNIFFYSIHCFFFFFFFSFVLFGLGFFFP